ncbi:MAG TPA: hypothetical protein DCQ64_24080 [Candidatus Rokubacteria bacterium]|nr:hypothetical protein [Candidatus Rokubacteria bacterium]
MANETLGAAAYIKARLDADAALVAVVSTRVYQGVAPQGDTYPLVVYSLQASRDINALGGLRVCTWPLWLVKVIGSNGPAALQGAADRIDAALVSRTVVETTIGGVTYETQCIREATVAYQDVSDGRRYDHIGGLYRLWCRVKP